MVSNDWISQDEHHSCKEALAKAWHSIADGYQIGEVVQDMGDGVFKVLTVVRIDAFEDGLRILVR